MKVSNVHQGLVSTVPVLIYKQNTLLQIYYGIYIKGNMKVN